MQSRFLSIPKTIINDIENLKKKLNIANPAYSYLKDKRGVPERFIKEPKYFPQYTETKTHLVLPREIHGDEDIIKHINQHVINDVIFLKNKNPLLQPGFKLRDYQIEPVASIIENKADIITMDCGGGKTGLSCYAIAHSELPVAVIVHTDFLANQWKQELEKFTTIKSIVIHSNTNVKKSMKADVVIFKIQSLLRVEYSDNYELFDRFKLAVFDEVHTMGASKFGPCIAYFNCKRIGVTATPDRTDGFKTYMWHIGCRIFKASGKQETTSKVICFDTGLGNQIKPSLYMVRTKDGATVDMNKLLDQQYALEKRFILTVNLIEELLKMGRHVVVLAHRREYVERLFNAIKFDDKELLYGGVDVPNHHKQLIVATFQLLRIAFNRPRLDTLVNTGTYGNPNDVQQSIGRIERDMDDKPIPIYIDMYEKDIMFNDIRNENGDGMILYFHKKRIAKLKDMKREILSTNCTSVTQVIELIRRTEK